MKSVATDQTPPLATGDKNAKTRVGARNITAQEIESLVDAMEEVHPLGSKEWAIVCDNFNESVEFADHHRDQDSIK